MAFKCTKKPPCLTDGGRIKSFQRVDTVIKHYDVVHEELLTKDQAIKYCMVTSSNPARRLVPFKPDDGSAPMEVDVASVALSSIGSIGLSKMGLANVNATEEAFLVACLAKRRARAAKIDEEGEDEDEEDAAEPVPVATRTTSRLKIGGKIKKETSNKKSSSSSSSSSSK